MPRSIKRPIIGQILWYYPSTPPTNPSAALVVNQSGPTAFGLWVFDRTNGAGSYVASVAFHDGTRPTTGAWCTQPRVYEPATGQWPSRGDASPPLGVGGVLT